MPTVDGVTFPSAPITAMEDTNSEEYWQARSDARTLREAEGVKADSSRLTNARYILEKEEAERVAALKSTEKANDSSST